MSSEVLCLCRYNSQITDQDCLHLAKRKVNKPQPVQPSAIAKTTQGQATAGGNGEATAGGNGEATAGGNGEATAGGNGKELGRKKQKLERLELGRKE